jgi:hypothetical protein
MLEKQQLGIKDALAELWRIHAGLSAEIIRMDWKDGAHTQQDVTELA